MSIPPKGRADHLVTGDYNALCHFCDRKRKASEMVRHWQGFYICPEHVGATRHPQEFVRGTTENPAAPWVQPQIDDFPGFCTPNGSSAIPGTAQPGCAVPSYLSPAYNPDSDI